MSAIRHPLRRFCDERQMNLREGSEHFGIPYGTFRQLVTGATACSWGRARAFEAKARGEVKATAIMRWQERNARLAA